MCALAKTRLMVNGGHKKNVWEIMRKCNKSVHLHPERSERKSRSNHPKDIRKILKRASEHFYCISEHIRDIA